jgi:hypothetical protein
MDLADRILTSPSAVRAAAALRANTRNHPSGYLGRNRVPPAGVENGENTRSGVSGG